MQMKTRRAGQNVNEQFVSDARYAHFRGVNRAAVKTSVARDTSGNICSPKVFADLVALIKSLQPNVEIFTSHALAKGSGRLPEEIANVRVPCWIGAVRHEADNDFLVILASAANTKAKSTRFMTAKVSGLPKAALDLEVLTKVRRQLVDFFPTQTLSDAFHEPDPPIKVCVEGSLFFPFEHAVFSEGGPPGMHPHTRWEIHPVTSIASD